MLFSRHQIMFTAAVAVLAASHAVLSCAAARGQQSSSSRKYKVASFSPEAKKLLNDRQKLNDLSRLQKKVVGGTEPFAENKTLLTTWYVGLTFPMMTRIQGGNGAPADAVKNLERSRTVLLRDIREQKNAEFRSWLMQQVVKIMPMIAANENFHPIARYNAMLTIAELNAKEAASVGAARRPPEPLSAAFPILREALVSEKQIDAVRTAAMVGILRHVELDPFRSRSFGDDDKQRLVDDILPIVQASEPPDFRSPGVHYWLRRRGTEVLARLQAPDEEGKVADALGGIVTDETAPRPLRCAAGEAIERTQRLPSLFVSEPTTLAVVMGKLAADSTHEAIEHIEEISLVAETDRGFKEGGVDGQFGGFPGMSGMGAGPDLGAAPGLGGGPVGRFRGDNETNLKKEVRKADWEKELELARRTLLTTLAMVHRGLRGPDHERGIWSLAQDEPHTTNISQLGEAVSALANICDAKHEEVEDLLNDLRQHSDQLDAEIASLERQADDGDVVIASGDQPGADNDGPDADGEDAEEQSLDFDGFQ